MDAALLAEEFRSFPDDRSHGARAGCRRAVETLSELTEIEASGCDDLLERLRDAGRQLATAATWRRRGRRAVGRVLAAVGHELCPVTVDDLRRLIQEEARALDDARRAAASITIQLRERLDGATVIRTPPLGPSARPSSRASRRR